MAEGDRERGLYQKYVVFRNRGFRNELVTEPCFVLKYGSDLHAAAALQAYAESCAGEYPELSKDLLAELQKWDSDGE